MSWIVASLVSAFFLGCYELCTKHAVRENAVLPVLFLSNVCSALIWLGLMAAAALAPSDFPMSLAVTPLGPREHGLLLLKSAVVAVSWTCTYFGVKHIPVSLSSPIRATGPWWTLVGALLLLGERPSAMELVGIAVTLGGFVVLSFVGSREGIHFHRNKWIGWLFLGALFNGASALYDKYLLGVVGLDVPTVQAWFSIYLALLFLPLAAGWKFRWWTRNPFHWRWSIVLLALALLVADYVYFSALRDPDALISIVSSFRRGSTLVAFVGSIYLFGEANARHKFFALLGVLAGIVLTVLG